MSTLALQTKYRSTYLYDSETTSHAVLDADLAKLYDVENKAVKRNLERFPKDFMFQLNKN